MFLLLHPANWRTITHRPNPIIFRITYILGLVQTRLHQYPTLKGQFKEVIHFLWQPKTLLNIDIKNIVVSQKIKCKICYAIP